jgi:hypothetical protein
MRTADVLLHMRQARDDPPVNDRDDESLFARAGRVGIEPLLAGGILGFGITGTLFLLP